MKKHKIFYAHSKKLYGTNKEKNQLRILSGMGGVVNPGSFSEEQWREKFLNKVARFNCRVCRQMFFSCAWKLDYSKCPGCGRELQKVDVILAYLLEINDCDELVFTDYLGFVSRGVYNEIMYAKSVGVKVVYMKNISFVKNYDINLYNVKDWKVKYAEINLRF